jgi:nucleoid-associated protein YgaU
MRPDPGRAEVVQSVTARSGGQGGQGTAQPAAQGADAAAPSRATTVVVSVGDTLWEIAAQQLGPQSTIEETAAAWPAIYSLNRDLIGPDPDVIEPGQRLVLPPTGRDGDAR